MIAYDVLQKAIAAHANWKGRLRTAASSGKFDGASSTVRADNQCDFGKWLYGPEISAVEKQTEHYRTVKQLHAQFHQEAAKVVEWITSGNKNAVEESMGMGGSYAKTSTALTQAMIKWRESLR